MADFSLDLASVAGELEADYNLLVRRFTLGLFRRVLRKSPVDTGRFRGNWIISIDTASATTKDVSFGETGTHSPAAASGSVNFAVREETPKVDGFDVSKNNRLILQNNLPYAEKLEGGSSKQAPQGILDISIREELQAFK